MKKFISIMLAAAVFAVPVAAKPVASSDSSLRLYLDADMYTGVKAGICRSFTERLSLYASAGICLAGPSQFTWNIFAGYELLDPRKKFHLDLNAGFIHGAMDVISQIYEPYFYANPGIAVNLSWPVAKTRRMGLRLGTEIMMGYDMGVWRFDPELEPNAALTFVF